MSKTAVKLFLASASPRRRELLAGLGLDFEAGGVNIDERQNPGESAAEMVQRLAVEKARRAASQRGTGTIVIGSDTTVVLDGRVFAKPADADDAARMLQSLSGRWHEVLTGVALLGSDMLEVTMSLTRVRFREVDPAEAALYWQSGEPADKAGGYAIQGLGGVFVEAIEGSYSGVVGLPVFETAELLRRAGIQILNSGKSNQL